MKNNIKRKAKLVGIKQWNQPNYVATATTATPGLKTVHDQYPVVRCHLHPAFAFAPTIPIIAIYSKSESLFDFLPQKRRQILKRGFFQSITNKKRRWKQKTLSKKNPTGGH